VLSPVDDTREVRFKRVIQKVKMSGTIRLGRHGMIRACCVRKMKGPDFETQIT
jgi:hypothetical protein